MLARVKSGAVVGVEGLLVDVEVDIAKGLPVFTTVGLAEGAVRESKERVRAAIRNSGYEFPNRRITINLAPADLKKAGTGYDLPIAVGILAAAELISPTQIAPWCLIGELSLDGTLRPTPGVLPMVLAARQAGVATVMVPRANAAEAMMVAGIKLAAVSSLGEAVDILRGLREPELPPPPEPESPGAERPDYEVDFAEVRGQEYVKRALEIAAAGQHNILLQGPPGTGKTMLARRLPTIMPELSFEEALETTRIYSVAGELDPGFGLLRRRPFRAPHHTISDAGLIGGGGQWPRPGQVSLAHKGVLFLDELPEFRKNVLESLRQPLEDGRVTIARSRQSLIFPADFMLVAALNPCPCGHYPGNEQHECHCTPAQIQRYRHRLSGPLLDRIDLYLEVTPVKFQEITDHAPGESSATIRKRVEAAHAIQRRRFSRRKTAFHNSRMTPRDLERHCRVDPAAHRLLEEAVRRFGLSARAYHRILKIARTIADLAGTADLATAHVAEAVQYRRLEFKK
ncbi:MAG TPA: ATP-binding protein [Desulfurivibrio alkaliphilus]|uniref:ATP-binding protein n=1 Tax=Desulfurivibrio alkaliphilus TaxID=427923 RepID=A0A7C2THZ6_9BACT|nr:ATP-binding protein [Desulfurivibrio alkaliphilus]